MNKISTYWIFGNSIDCKNAMNSIICQSKIFEYEIFKLHCGNAECDASGSDIVNILKSRNIFDSQKRIIKVYGVPSDYQIIEEYLHLTNEKNMLVFYGAPNIINKGGKNTSIQNSKLFKSIKENGKVYEFVNDGKNDRECVSWLKKQCSIYNIKISDECLNKIVFLNNKNLDRLFSEIQKISLYSNNDITEENVLECCGVSNKQQTVWDFLDCLDMCKYEDVIRYLNENTYYGLDSQQIPSAIYGLLYVMMQHYMFLMVVKDKSADFVDDDNVRKSCSGWKKINPSQIKMIKSGEIKIDELEDMFKSNYISFNLFKETTKVCLKWKKSKIYGILDCIYRCFILCRYNAREVNTVSMLFSILCLFVCNKITYEQSCMVLNVNPKQMR